MSDFTCVKCKKTYQKLINEEWNDIKAAEEFITLFPECKNDETDLICEYCFEKFKIWFDKLPEQEQKIMKENIK